MQKLARFPPPNAWFHPSLSALSLFSYKTSTVQVLVQHPEAERHEGAHRDAHGAQADDRHRRRRPSCVSTAVLARACVSRTVGERWTLSCARESVGGGVASLHVFLQKCQKSRFAKKDSPNTTTRASSCRGEEEVRRCLSSFSSSSRARSRRRWGHVSGGGPEDGDRHPTTQRVKS